MKKINFLLISVLISTHVFAREPATTTKLPTDVSLSPDKEAMDRMFEKERLRRKRDKNDHTYTEIGEFRFENRPIANLIEQNLRQNHIGTNLRIDSESIKFSRTVGGLQIGALMNFLRSYSPFEFGKSVRKFKMFFNTTPHTVTSSCNFSVEKYPSKEGDRITKLVITSCHFITSGMAHIRLSKNIVIDGDNALSQHVNLRHKIGEQATTDTEETAVNQNSRTEGSLIDDSQSEGTERDAEQSTTR